MCTNYLEGVPSWLFSLPQKWSDIYLGSVNGNGAEGAGVGREVVATAGLLSAPCTAPDDTSCLLGGICMHSAFT